MSEDIEKALITKRDKLLEQIVRNSAEGRRIDAELIDIARDRQDHSMDGQDPDLDSEFAEVDSA